MTDDFEDNLRRRLNEHVDAVAGAQRSAPPFDPDRGAPTRTAAHRVRTRWLPPLLAAACIAVLVGGGVATSQLLSADRNPAGPVTPAPRPTSSLPTPTTAPTATPTTVAPSPTHVPSPGAPSHTAARPAGGSGSSSRSKSSDTHVVQLGAASISLPNGWVARDLSDYYGSSPADRSPAPGWCLTPASSPAKKNQDACPVEFYRLGQDGFTLDPDVQGGFYVDTEPCLRDDVKHQIDHESAERTFGGRAGDYRRQHDHCRNGKQVYVEQYVVPTVPSYALSSRSGSDRDHDAMVEIAARSTLPDQTAPLRLVDGGYVRSIQKDGKYVRIRLDRAYESGKINKNPETYAYAVPSSVVAEEGYGPKIGDYYRVRTDGHRVIDGY